MSLLSITATGGLILLALHDSLLLATLLAAGLAWTWYKQQSSEQPKQQQQQQQSYQAEKKVETVAKSEAENVLEDEEEFDEAVEKSNVELLGSIQSFEPEALNPVKTVAKSEEE